MCSLGSGRAHIQITLAWTLPSTNPPPGPRGEGKIQEHTEQLRLQSDVVLTRKNEQCITLTQGEGYLGVYIIAHAEYGTSAHGEERG